MIIGREFAEKLYSANEYYEDEKLYSTGDDELDDLLEKAFCEGYEYAQREFDDKSFLTSKDNFIGRAVRSIKASNKKRKHVEAYKEYMNDRATTYNNKMVPAYKKIEDSVKRRIGNIGSTEAQAEISKKSTDYAKGVNKKLMDKYLQRIKKI